MRRRVWLTGLAGGATVAGVAGGAWLATAKPGVVQTFPDMASAQRAVQTLGAGSRTSGGFVLAQMLEHCAQSVEYSLDGFPQLKSAAFRGTAGALAFAVFDARGAMSHSLTEPIPGAPPLAPNPMLEPAQQRLLQALARFEAHSGPLAPHFAYGALDKTQYRRAHLMHLANHWSQVSSA